MAVKVTEYVNGYQQPPVTAIKHAGLVVDLGSQYLGDGESSYYAVVWNEAENKPQNVYYGSDRGNYGNAEIDAPAEIIAKYEAYKAALVRAAAVRQAEQNATRVAWGKDVIVVRGRKVPIGTKGDVFWVGQTQYGTRVGIRLKNGEKVFTAIGNVEVENPDKYIPEEYKQLTGQAA